MDSNFKVPDAGDDEEVAKAISGVLYMNKAITRRVFLPNSGAPKDARYFNSFVNYPDFYDKRFYRYVDRVKDAWVKLYLSPFWKRWFDHRNYISSRYPKDDPNHFIYKVDTVENFIRSIFSWLYSEIGVSPLDGPLFSCIRETLVHKTFGHDFSLWDDRDRAEKVLNFISGKTKTIKGISFGDIMEWEIKEECVDRIRTKCMDEDIDEISYMQTVPKTMEECIVMVTHVLDLVLTDLDFLFIEDIMAVAAKESEEITELNSKNEELEQELASLRKQVAALESANRKLTAQVGEKKENDEIAALKEDTSILRRQNAKLKNKLASVCAKYTRLKEAQGSDVETEVADEVIDELDMYGNYLFLADENSTFQRNIQEAFPNAKFCTSGDEAVTAMSNVDMVIVISSHIDHSTYGNFKKRCKNLKIPFVHCEYSNIDLIRDLMASQLFK